MSNYDPERSSWEQVKPYFYEDASAVSSLALTDLRQRQLVLSPDRLANAPDRPFYELETLLKLAVANSFEAVASMAPTCLYHEVLDRKLGKRSLGLTAGITGGQKTLLETSLPGGYEAPVLITNLVSRMDAAAQIHRIAVEPQVLANNSSGLLHEPLRHPQQWARAFLFTLVDPEAVFCMGGEAYTFRRENGFLSDEILAEYTRIEDSASGPKLVWAKPIGEFTIKAPVRVHNRVLGSERVNDETNVVYPSGTKLLDIAVDEPTLSCPGKPMAYFLWKEAVRLAHENNLWERAKNR